MRSYLGFGTSEAVQVSQ